MLTRRRAAATCFLSLAFFDILVSARDVVVLGPLWPGPAATGFGWHGRLGNADVGNRFPCHIASALAGEVGDEGLRRRAIALVAGVTTVSVMISESGSMAR